MTSILFKIFESYSSYVDLMNKIFFYFLIAGGIIFILVLVSTLFIALRFKQDKQEEKVSTAKISNKLELFTILAASSLIFVFLSITINGVSRIQESISKDKKADIIVTGHQWWWEIEYPNDSVKTANELHIPVGKKLLLELRSADVIHDLNIPALARKMDMIPGMNNHMWIEARKIGIYEGCCNEYCGAQHAWMRIQVFAQEREDYEKWLQEQVLSIKDIRFTKIEKIGKNLFEKKVCGNCHAIKGTSGLASIGPDLTHIASRKKILAGKLNNNIQNLYEWIKNPQKLKPKAHMPNFILTDDEAYAIATYLNTLQ